MSANQSNVAMIYSLAIDRYLQMISKIPATEYPNEPIYGLMHMTALLIYVVGVDLNFVATAKNSAKNNTITIIIIVL
jgi:hypothetical protein